MERVYCKRNVIYQFSKFENKRDFIIGQYARFHKGKYYEIKEVVIDSYWIKYVDHWGNNTAQRFFFDSESNRHMYLFSDYFYTESELRREKLLKIGNEGIL